MSPETPHRMSRLALADGALFRGRAFGASGVTRQAEVVFNTAMSGYQESLTDPSYSGQILVMTAPLIGNTGVNEQDLESSRVHVAGFVVRELARLHSNYRATRSLHAYLVENGVLGLQGVDTRAITRRIRIVGAMPGMITDDPDLPDAELVLMARRAPSMAGLNLVPGVSCSGEGAWEEDLADWAPERTVGDDSGFTVMAIDCGAKRNILRHLTDRGCRVRILPHAFDPERVLEDFRAGRVHGLFISNGPGDPAAVSQTIDALRRLVGPHVDPPIPTFGICLGHQLLALALGARTFKLKFGHRGINQPVHNTLRGRIEITSQNHGFAVDPGSLAEFGGQPTHINLNDGTLAGFRLKDRPLFAVQHHPEASPGPHDAGYLFDAFVRMMGDGKSPSRESMLGPPVTA